MYTAPVGFGRITPRDVVLGVPLKTAHRLGVGSDVFLPYRSLPDCFRGSSAQEREAAVSRLEHDGGTIEVPGRVFTVTQANPALKLQGGAIGDFAFTFDRPASQGDIAANRTYEADRPLAKHPTLQAELGISPQRIHTGETSGGMLAVADEAPVGDADRWGQTEWQPSDSDE
ncbi:MAG: hypothetical protein KC475_03310 [Cyanobacteria bacterium HKST-UBA03]|nr:hypothetical protein [Cyanobacteria bacterium HKST-UBA03]